MLSVIVLSVVRLSVVAPWKVGGSDVHVHVRVWVQFDKTIKDIFLSSHKLVNS